MGLVMLCRSEGPQQMMGRVDQSLINVQRVGVGARQVGKVNDSTYGGKAREGDWHRTERPALRGATEPHKST